MEERRQKLVRTECSADLILGITAQPESRAVGDVPPFAHTAMVVNDPKASDAHNGRVLAQAMATLFGAPPDPRGAGTVMTQPPESDRLPKAAAKLISRMRDYQFSNGAAGIDAADGDRALRAITAANTGRGNPALAAHRTLGLALAADGRFAGAARHLTEVVKLDPRSVAARVELATMCSHAYQHAEAAEHFREATLLEPDNAAHHAGLAVALSNQGKIEEGIEEFEAALRIDPKFAAAQAGLAYLFSQQLGRIDESIAAYRTALAMNPELPAAAEGLERALDLKEKAAAAAAEQRRRAEKPPGNAETLFDLGLSEARAGNVEAALRALRRAVELDGRHARAHANLAMLLYLQKDYAQALREAEAARRGGFDPPPRLMDLLKRKNGR
jgi:tetratricopeptide (TPR) repeat protein